MDTRNRGSTLAALPDIELNQRRYIQIGSVFWATAALLCSSLKITKQSQLPTFIFIQKRHNSQLSFRTSYLMSGPLLVCQVVPFKWSSTKRSCLFKQLKRDETVEKEKRRRDISSQDVFLDSSCSCCRMVAEQVKTCNMGQLATTPGPSSRHAALGQASTQPNYLLLSGAQVQVQNSTDLKCIVRTEN